MTLAIRLLSRLHPALHRRRVRRQHRTGLRRPRPRDGRDPRLELLRRFFRPQHGPHPLSRPARPQPGPGPAGRPATDLAIPCAACFSRLAAADLALQQDAAFRAQMESVLDFQLPEPRPPPQPPRHPGQRLFQPGPRRPRSVKPLAGPQGRQPTMAAFSSARPSTPTAGTTPSIPSPWTMSWTSWAPSPCPGAMASTAAAAA